MGDTVTGPNINAYWTSDIYRAYYTTGKKKKKKISKKFDESKINL